MTEKPFRIDNDQRFRRHDERRNYESGGDITGRIGPSVMKLTVAESRRAEVLEEKFTKPSPKDFLDLWLKNNDLAPDNDFPIHVRENPDGAPRNSLKVAFGDPEQQPPRNIIILRNGHNLDEESIKLAQSNFPEGVTVVAPVELVNNTLNMPVDAPGEGRDSILRENDAVVGFYGMPSPTVETASEIELAVH